MGKLDGIVAVSVAPWLILLFQASASGAAPGWQKEPTSYRSTPFGVGLSEARATFNIAYCDPDETETETALLRSCTVLDIFSVSDVEVRETLMFLRDQLAGVNWSFPADSYETLKDVFRSRYGPPMARETSTLQNRMGARYTNEELTWRGKKIFLSLKRYGGDLETGFMFLATESYINESARERQRKKKKAAEKF